MRRVFFLHPRIIHCTRELGDAFPLFSAALPIPPPRSRLTRTHFSFPPSVRKERFHSFPCHFSFLPTLCLPLFAFFWPPLFLLSCPLGVCCCPKTHTHTQDAICTPPHLSHFTSLVLKQLARVVGAETHLELGPAQTQRACDASRTS